MIISILFFGMFTETVVGVKYVARTSASLNFLDPLEIGGGLGHTAKANNFLAGFVFTFYIFVCKC